MGSYKYGGISGGLGNSGIGGNAMGSYAGINRDPYIENSQGAQGSIGSSGSRNKKSAHGMNRNNSRGSDFKLPTISNKMAMGGMNHLPGMPGSKHQRASRGAGSKGGGYKPPIGGGGNFKSNAGAGY